MVHKKKQRNAGRFIVGGRRASSQPQQFQYEKQTTVYKVYINTLLKVYNTHTYLLAKDNDRWLYYVYGFRHLYKGSEVMQSLAMYFAFDMCCSLVC